METIGSLTGDIENKLPPIIIGSFMLVAGLAWNDAVISAINYYVPENYRNSDNVLYKFLYAFCMSIIIIIMISVFSHFITRHQNK